MKTISTTTRHRDRINPDAYSITETRPGRFIVKLGQVPLAYLNSREDADTEVATRVARALAAPCNHHYDCQVAIDPETGLRPSGCQLRK